MSEVEEIRRELERSFPELSGALRVQRERRLWLDVDPARLLELLRFAYDRLEFRALCTITGLDEGAQLACIYHLARDSGTVLNVRTSRPYGESLETVSELYPAGSIYEREIVDLFGAQVNGLPPGPRYPLPDDWPEGQFPLRKSWRTPAGAATSADAPRSAAPAAEGAPAVAAQPPSAAPADTPPAAPLPHTEESDG